MTELETRLDRLEAALVSLTELALGRRPRVPGIGRDGRPTGRNPRTGRRYETTDFLRRRPLARVRRGQRPVIRGSAEELAPRDRGGYAVRARPGDPRGRRSRTPAGRLTGDRRRYRVFPNKRAATRYRNPARSAGGGGGGGGGRAASRERDRAREAGSNYGRRRYRLK